MLNNLFKRVFPYFEKIIKSVFPLLTCLVYEIAVSEVFKVSIKIQRLTSQRLIYIAYSQTYLLTHILQKLKSSFWKRLLSNLLSHLLAMMLAFFLQRHTEMFDCQFVC